MLGTEYLLRARGGSQASHKGFNAQLLAVNHKPTINHVQAAPRTMTAVLPVPESQVRLTSVDQHLVDQHGTHAARALFFQALPQIT